MAARCKLTPEVQERICAAIGMGATYEHASAYGGIHYDTFRTWVTTKPAFSEAVKAAEAKGVLACLARIREAAAAGAWQASAWILERRYPHAYGRQVHQVEHSGPDGGPLHFTLRIDRGVAFGEDGPDPAALEGG